MVGANPSKIAMLILKINVYLFVITLGANLLMLFPFYMHITQISNNVAMDVANRNYTTHKDLSLYIDHLSAQGGDANAVPYSLMAFDKANRVGSSQSLESGAVSAAKLGGQTSFSNPLNPDPNSYISKSIGDEVASVSVKAIGGSKDGKSLIACKGACASEFNPLTNNQDMIAGMDGTGMTADSTLVNRGTPFKVSVKTRYKLSGGTLGFMFHAGLPVTVETIGVTTQYYQYDSE